MDVLLQIPVDNSFPSHENLKHNTWVHSESWGMAILHDFHGFMALSVLARIPNLVHGGKRSLCVCCCSVVWPLRPHGLNSPPMSSVYRILQARILEWVAISSSRKSSPPRDQTWVSCISCIGKQILYVKTYDSSLVHLVEMVLSVSNLICSFNSISFLFIYPAAFKL